MAGFFGIGDYTKPGRGVSKDEPQKHSFFAFFEIYVRKFWKLIEINMLFFVFCIPFFIPFILTNLLVSTSMGIIYYISVIPFAGIAINISGLTYILRNFAREEHAFLWGDFIDTIKKNWKQSLIIGLIDLVVYSIMTFSINFYYYQISQNNAFVLLFVICIMFTVIFTFMQFYLFIMLITFDLSIRQLLKNALIFAFLGIGRNILITFSCGLLALVVYIFNPFSLFLTPFILISTFGFIIVFNAWKLIDKFMMPKNEEDDAEDVIFQDTGRR